MRLLLLIILIDIFAFQITSNAQTLLPSIINEKMELDSDSSPYLIGSNTEISASGELHISKGVTILINSGGTITNNGRFIINGSKTNPVTFTCSTSGEKWNYIKNNNTLIADDLLVQYAVRFVSSSGDTLILNDCTVNNTWGGIGDDLVGVHYAKKVFIKQCFFEGNPDASRIDAIDLDGISNDTIMENTIINFADDGVDIGTNSSNIYIANNTISACNMGLSIGENSTCTVYRNLLFDNDGGIQSHTGAVVTAINNTLYFNNEGLRLYHNSGQTTSGGTIHIKNSIIEACQNYLITSVKNSTLTVNYCLSDSILPYGDGNILAKASFISTEGLNFGLNDNSPAIDAGNPDTDQDNADFNTDIDDQDIDGSRLDMGYLPLYHVSSLIINELMPSNINYLTDEFDQYPDWVEISNKTDEEINLNGYYFTDNKNNITKHQITEDLIVPANGFVMLWPDDGENTAKNHLPFKLSGSGEYFSIADINGNIIDEVEFPMVPFNTSYGRDIQTLQWVHFETPTPNNTNSGTSKFGVSQKPIFSHIGGGVIFPTNTTLSAANNNSEIMFSIDGENPFNAQNYAAPIDINETSTIRAIATEPNYMSSFVSATTYYSNQDIHLPVLSISTDYSNLYDSTGIYTNYSKSGSVWEKPASISYYDEDLKFSITAGVRIQGGNSVYMPKKSFRLFFRGGYGESKLSTSPFENGPTSFENLVLRGGYDDDISTSKGTLLRDPLSAEFWSLLGETATKSNFASLYLNNNYWGIYNIRESINEVFVEDNLGIKDFDLVRFQKWGNALKYGSLDSWNELEAFFENTDFTQDDAFNAASEILDMNSFLNLLAFVHCTQFRSWTWGAFGIKPTDGKWTWSIWDTDRAYSILSWNGFTEYANTSAEKWPNIYPQKLLKNEPFKYALINRVCDLLNTTFKTENSLPVFDSLKAVIEPEINNEFERWNSGNIAKWTTNTNNIRDFLKARPTVVHQQIMDYFAILDSIQVTIKVIGKGKVKLNSITINQEQWNGIYMANIPISLKAIPDFGANFIGWENISTKEEITHLSNENITIVAVFDNGIADALPLPLVITEIMYHPTDNAEGEWIELYNPNFFAVSLNGYSFTDGGVDNLFKFSTNASIEANNYLIVTADKADFNLVYSQVINTVGDFDSGVYGFSLNNHTDNLLLYNNNQQLIDSVTYVDAYPWPEEADGIGASLQLIKYDFDNSLADNWYASMNNISSPGSENRTSTLSPKYASFVIEAYPNPFSEVLNISIIGANNTEATVDVLDLSGRIVRQFNAIKLQENVPAKIKLNGQLDKGIYFVRIKLLQDRECRTEIMKVISNFSQY